MPERLTLVACRRPADAPLILDLGIPNDGVSPGMLTGVLSSWEERFGLVPERLYPAWTSFQALAPPTTHESIELLAGELCSFATAASARAACTCRHSSSWHGRTGCSGGTERRTGQTPHRAN